ncbi:UNKNOWN [Stylonychia lemnae]|uniref:Uncharacterized protein n=1 Tax=Stylonychia lemnae TaxID=5949 RepID=A0A078ABH1_STYLE|nr:UNKNOWN [Stylonychia lemnae]|eukprot:CDW78922.1 UNKNOWN [Stylonychia lemnae]
MNSTVSRKQIPSLKNNHSLQNLKIQPLRIREERLKKVFLSPNRNNSCLSPSQKNITSQKSQRKKKIDVVTSKYQTNNNIPSKTEKEMLQQIQRHVQTSRRAAEEIKRLEKNIKMQSKQLKMHQEEFERKEQQTKLTRTMTMGSMISTNVSGNYQKAPSVRQSFSNKRDNSMNNSRVRFADQEDAGSRHEISFSKKSTDSNKRESIKNNCYYGFKAKNLNNTYFNSNVVNSSIQLQRIGQRAVNIQSQIDNQRRNKNVKSQKNAEFRKSSLSQASARSRSRSKSNNSISRYGMNQLKQYQVKENNLSTNQSQMSYLIMQKEPSRIELMKSNLKQSLDFIKKQKNQSKKDLLKQNKENMLLSNEKNQKIKKCIDQFSPVLQISIEKSQIHQTQLSKIFSQQNLFSPVSMIKGKRDYDCDLFSNNESLYRTTDPSRPLQEVLNYKEKNQNEIDRLRQLRQISKTNLNVFSCTKQPQVKKKFMNYICESSDSDSTTNEFSSNYI